MAMEEEPSNNSRNEVYSQSSHIL